MHADYHPGQLVRAYHARTTGSIRTADVERALALADQPTRVVPVVRKPSRLRLERDRSTKPLLPLDASGRPYVLVSDSEISTEQLVIEAVSRFCWYTGQAPTCILLSLPRYFSIEAKGYRVGGKVIFFDCSGLRDYDVLVR